MKTIPGDRAIPGKRRAGVGLWSVIEILFLIFNLVFFAGIAKKWLWMKIPPVLAPIASVASVGMTAPVSSRLNVLCMGVDTVEGSHRTDTLLLVGLNPARGEAFIVSIPRDTRVLIDGIGRKINEMVARHGVQALRSLIEDLLEVKIDRVVKVDFNGFVKIVDLIGGIDFSIDRPMNYDDVSGNVHIHFASGSTHLSGQRALEFVRFRADAAADLGRIKRQQKFLAAVLAKLKNPALVLKLPEIVGEAFKHIETDFALAECVELLASFRETNLVIQSQSLPGEAKYMDKISFYIPYKDQAVALGVRHFTDLSSFELNASFSQSISSSSGFIATTSPTLDISRIPAETKMPKTSKRTATEGATSTKAEETKETSTSMATAAPVTTATAAAAMVTETATAAATATETEATSTRETASVSGSLTLQTAPDITADSHPGLLVASITSDASSGSAPSSGFSASSTPSVTSFPGVSAEFSASPSGMEEATFPSITSLSVATQTP